MKRILIIEDQPDEIEKLKKEFIKPGIRIDLAGNSLESFYLINQYDYETIIVSNDLEDLNGIWIVNYILKKFESHVILTCHNEIPGIMTLLKKSGVTFYKK